MKRCQKLLSFFSPLLIFLVYYAFLFCTLYLWNRRMEWSAWKKKKKKKKKEEKKKEEGHQGLLGRFGRSIDGDRFVSSDIMGLTAPRLCKWMETSETNISFLNKKKQKKEGKEEEEKKNWKRERREGTNVYVTNKNCYKRINENLVVAPRISGAICWILHWCQM